MTTVKQSLEYFSLCGAACQREEERKEQTPFSSKEVNIRLQKLFPTAKMAEKRGDVLICLKLKDTYLRYSYCSTFAA